MARSRKARSQTSRGARGGERAFCRSQPAGPLYRSVRLHRSLATPESGTRPERRVPASLLTS